MEAIITALAFGAFTVAMVAIHVRRGRSDAKLDPCGRPCPRCGGMVGPDLTACPGCGVPLQLYEVVAAPLAEPVESSSGDGHEHAVVRSDRCVGCGTCVAACPEPGALFLKGKLAVVNLDLCKGHGDCAAACPVGAIGVGAGDAVQRVEVPEVDGTFQTNVPGIYIVGELGGRGLIKNAINEGRVAAESAARELEREGRVGDRSLFDLVIVGSGPAGLSAGLEAKRRELRYLILEQGTVADTIRKYPRHKLLLAEPVHVPLYGDLWVADASKETLLEMWETIIRNMALRLETECRVESVAREAGGFRISTVRGDFRARRVILAMGRRGTPRRLGVPGENLNKVFYDVVEMEEFAGLRVLVIGGGDSAVESALGLGNQKDTVVHLAYRGAEFSRVKDRNREKLDAAVAAGKVRLLLGTEIDEIREDAVVLRTKDGQQTLPNDNVIIRIGGEPPVTFLNRTGIRIVQKDVPMAGV